MIAVVKRWYALLFALLFFIPLSASAAEDGGGAARELARKTGGFVGKGAGVAVTWRTLTSSESIAAQARSAFEAALQDAGLHLTDAAPSVELRITVSENATQYLLIAEVSRGDERQVWMASWKRVESTGSSPLAALDKKLLWEQDEQILDVAFPAAGMLVLSPTGVTFYTRAATQWEPQRSLPFNATRPLPRDLRGHLRLKGAGFQTLLPGLQCEGTLEPAPSMDCHPSDEPWVLESGSRALLLANLAAGRNYFDGRITTQSGQRKTVAPFYSAASVQSQGRTLWLLATLDGKTQIFDATFDPVGVLPAVWGSDIGGVETHCGAGSQVLAASPSDRGQPDNVQAFTVSDHNAEALSEAADFPGPVLALWATSGNGLTVLVRNLRSGKYAAYSLTVVCGG